MFTSSGVNILFMTDPVVEAVERAISLNGGTDWLYKKFTEMGVNLYPQKWDKWKERGIPKKNLVHFSKAFNWDLAGLYEGDIRPGKPESKYFPEQITIRGWIPLISYIQAGAWSETIDIYEPGYAERVLPTAAPHSKFTFALRVEGWSMTLPVGIPGNSFPPGMIIYVDPERECRPKDLVVARFKGDATFKQLILDEGRPVLMPLNPDRKEYPIIRDEFELIGKVIDASLGGL